MKILVRNLAKTTNEEKIYALFSEYGAIQYCNLILDDKTGASKGFAFVEMPKSGEAKVAIQKLNGYKLAGNIIRVKKAEVKKETLKTEVNHSENNGIKSNANNALNIYGTPKQSD
ncbi:RNA-binding protein [Psychromonas sp. MME2]|uniref:RNA recognition motif domain-containing protein n=1 Tax=unclassified Psychromonas TaxID=2614957 RepID=UPI00339C3118